QRRLRLLSHDGLQATPFCVFGDDEWTSIKHSHVTNLNDIWMIETCEGFGFNPKPSQVLKSRASTAQDHLQTNRFRCGSLLGLVNNSHPPLAEHANNLVARQCGESLR